MKIGILHLSDLHFKKNNYDLVNTLNIENVIKYYENIEKIILIISGDIANTSKREEYACADKFIYLLKHALNKYNVELQDILIVPGNHDICLQKDGRNIDDIRDYYKSGIVAEKLEEEFNLQSNFFNFSKKYHIFENRSLVDIKNISIGNSNIRFVLINSAPFSTLTNAVHNDKDVHYCKDNIINQISHNDTDYIFTIMHHSCEWFEDESKTQLEDLITNTSEAVFIGHEHIDNLIGELKDARTTIISKCGEINFEKCSGSFNFITLEDTDAKLTIDKFLIERGQNLKQVESESINTYLNVKKTLLISKRFTRNFYKDQTLNIDEYSSMFIFPKILHVSDEKIIKKDVDELIESFSDNKIIAIKGFDRCGKTTLLKEIYRKYSKKYVPLYMDIDDIGNSGKVLKNIINDCVKEQYSKDAIDIFIQNDINNKILLIDNINHLDKRIDKDDFFKYILGNFGKIICTTSSKEWENIKEKYKESMLSDVDEYLLQPFAVEKREELVDKLSLFYKCNDKDRITGIKKCLEKIYENKTLIVGSTLDFLVRYIKKMIETESYIDDQYYNVYNGLFENDITDLLASRVERKYIDDYKKIYSRISYFMHDNKCPIVAISDITKIITEYNDYFGKRIQVNSFISDSIELRIMTSNCNDYMFATKLHLAFFVAKYIYEKINKGELEDFSKCLENICFGINDDIVLFVINLSNNEQLVNLIYEKILEFYDGWEKLNLEKINIDYLKGSYDSNEKIRISAEDRDNYRKEKDRIEQIDLDKLEVRCEGIYDYDENDINNYENCLNKAVKLEEILSKIIAVSHNFISYKQRNDMLKVLSDCSYKTIYYALKVFDEDFEGFINEFVNSEIRDDIKGAEKRKEFFRNGFIMFSVKLIHILIRKFSFSISDENSRRLIENLNGDSNDKMFSLYVMTNIHNTNSFAKYVEENFLNINQIISNLSILAINDYGRKNKLDNSERDKLSSTLEKKLSVSSKSFKRVSLSNS